MIREACSDCEDGMCKECGMTMEACECAMSESAPPGREKQVKGIKKRMKKGDIPKTYTDSSGKRKKSNPWAMAWAQHNKE